MFVLGALYVAVGAASRLALWWGFGPAADVSALYLPWLLLGGMINDLAQSVYLLAPLSLYLFLLPDRWYRSRFNRWLLGGGTAVTIALWIYLAVVEHYFFEEFDARFNVVAVDYLIYPTEVAGDIWDAYPVIRALLATVVLTAGLMWWTRNVRRSGFDLPARLAARAPLTLMHGVALLAVLLLWRTSTLSLSGNRVANEILQNGHSSFFRAVATNDIDYHVYYASRDRAENLATLSAALGAGGGQFTHLAEGRIDRMFPARPDGLGKMNVVLVASESFGAEFSRLYGAELDLTPEFDKYAQQGIWFAHTYASGTRTVRGLEALTSSFPPIPTVSILRRPGNEGIATWGGVMRAQGYQTSFFYGGYAYFDNMSHFYASNGFEVLDRSAIETPRFSNIWGVSDEDLFDMAIGRFTALSARSQPFFSIIMTTSNHKPFTFRSGLESEGIPASGGGRGAGVRYADYALGYFLRTAARQPWFDNTIFVVVADHGARVYGKAQIPLKTYEIPLMIYAPGHIAPRRVETLMTQMDVAPTVLGLLGQTYEAPFLGQDVLHYPEGPRVALFNHNQDVAILRGDKIVVFGLQRRINTFRYDRNNDTYEVAPRDPELENLGIAYFQTASELFKAHEYR